MSLELIINGEKCVSAETLANLLGVCTKTIHSYGRYSGMPRYVEGHSVLFPVNRCCKWYHNHQAEIEQEKRRAKLSTLSICWFCKRPHMAESCSWHRNFTPVDGWKAIPNKKSFNVRECPKFIQVDRKIV